MREDIKAILSNALQAGQLTGEALEEVATYLEECVEAIQRYEGTVHVVAKMLERVEKLENRNN